MSFKSNKKRQNEAIKIEGHSFRVYEGKLVIDEKIFLGKGESWHHSGTPEFQSMITVEVPEIFVENKGFVDCAKMPKNGLTTEISAVVIVTGSKGTCFGWNIVGIAFFFLLLASLILVFIMERRASGAFKKLKHFK
ncbi:MAG: hypothetical protein QW400_01820 [Candidatus Diapherotrites archaeon]